MPVSGKYYRFFFLLLDNLNEKLKDFTFLRFFSIFYSLVEAHCLLVNIIFSALSRHSTSIAHPTSPSFHHKWFFYDSHPVNFSLSLLTFACHSMGVWSIVVHPEKREPKNGKKLTLPGPGPHTRAFSTNFILTMTKLRATYSERRQHLTKIDLPGCCLDVSFPIADSSFFSALLSTHTSSEAVNRMEICEKILAPSSFLFFFVVVESFFFLEGSLSRHFRGEKFLVEIFAWLNHLAVIAISRCSRSLLADGRRDSLSASFSFLSAKPARKASQMDTRRSFHASRPGESNWFERQHPKNWRWWLESLFLHFPPRLSLPHAHHPRLSNRSSPLT